MCALYPRSTEAEWIREVAVGGGSECTQRHLTLPKKGRRDSPPLEPPNNRERTTTVVAGVDGSRIEGDRASVRPSVPLSPGDLSQASIFWR